jgi:aerobic carbon-monoxide dehydrogenase large subunit
MPLTPQRVWAAISDARAGRLEPSWREPPAIFERMRTEGIGSTAVSTVSDADV